MVDSVTDALPAEAEVRAQTPEEQREYMHKYFIAHREKFRERYRNYYVGHLEHERERNWKTYGIVDIATAKALYEATTQCEICGSEVTGKNKALDHNHKTRLVRGILCRKCNLMLGYADDNPLLLHRAVEYLKEEA